MTSSFNRYRHWLGISDPQPDHFQLLGIGPSEMDSAKIENAAKIALKKIGQPPTDSTEPEWQKLKREIRAAYRCLSDPKTRQAYLAELASRATDISLDLDVDNDNTAAGYHDETPESEFVESPEASATKPVPMATVVDAPPIAGAVEDHRAEVQVSAASAGPKISTKVSTRIRRRGWKGFIFAIIATVVLVGVIAAVIWYILQQQQKTVEDQIQSNASQETDSAEVSSSKTNLRETPIGPDEVDQRSDDLVNSDTNEHDRSMDSNRSPKSDELNESDAADNHSPLDASIEALKEVDGTSDVTETSAIERGLLQGCLQKAWFALQMRDWEFTKKQLELAKSLNLSQQHRDLIRRLENVSDTYKSFWNRVGDKARQLPALTELEINDMIVSVTEAKPEEIVFRAKGVRLTYEYLHIPDGIAVAIAAHEEDESDPDYLMELCAAYAVATRQNPRLANKTRKIFKSAEQSSVRVGDLRDFIEDDYDSVSEKLLAPSLPPRTMLKQARTELADQLEEMKLRWQDPFAVLLAAERAWLESDSDPTRWVIGEFAVEQAIENRDAFSLRHQLLIFDADPQSNTAKKRLVDKMNALSRQNLDRMQAVRLVQICADFADSHESTDESHAEKFVQIARKVASEHGLSAWEDLLKRRYDDRLDSDTGRLSL